ncbi:MAG: hypothetical protein PHC89_02835 [Candidatus Pacebacteria bacterium]|nr:hypothetical protein [Candidatus Paceibacterota bacterium]
MNLKTYKLIAFLLTIVLIGIIFLNKEIFIPSPKSEEISTNEETQLSSYIQNLNISENEMLSSPLSLTGEARLLYSEGIFPIEIISKEGSVVASASATALGDWMTEDFVPFEAVLTFLVEKDTEAFVVLKKSNPSGEKENGLEFQIPVLLKAPEESPFEEIALFVYDPEVDSYACSKKGLIPIRKTIEKTDDPITASVELLLSSTLSEDERALGYINSFPLFGFELGTARIEDGVVTLSFIDPYQTTSGGACRVEIMKNQIETTVLQFKNVREVNFLPQELFQP